MEAVGLSKWQVRLGAATSHHWPNAAACLPARPGAACCPPACPPACRQEALQIRMRLVQLLLDAAKTANAAHVLVLPQAHMPVPGDGTKRRTHLQRLPRPFTSALLAILLVLAAAKLQQPGASQQRRPGSAVNQQLEQAMPAAALPPGFRFNKVVAIIAFDRFEYFRQVIDALRQAWGAHEYVVTIWIDGPPQNASSFDQEGWQSIVTYSHQLAWLARNASLGFRDVVVNAAETNVGVWANKKRSVAGAMELSDFAVILEDDIVVERDALRWFEWHVTSGLIFDRPDIALATCWSTSFPYHHGAVDAHDLLMVQQLGLLDKYWLYSWAQPWGWALWRRTWDALGAEWNGRDKKLGRQIQERSWLGTMPLVARCNNIGSMGFHKKGVAKGHVHRRAVTSGSFASLAHCTYAELPRRNVTGKVALEELYDFVRRGLGGNDVRYANASFEEHLLAASEFLRKQPAPWHSSC